MPDDVAGDDILAVSFPLDAGAQLMIEILRMMLAAADQI